MWDPNAVLEFIEGPEKNQESAYGFKYFLFHRVGSATRGRVYQHD